MIYDLEVRADKLEMEAELMKAFEEKLIEETKPLKRFEISFYGWLPSYGDFDQEFFELNAESEEESENWVRKRYKWIKGGIWIKEIPLKINDL